MMVCTPQNHKIPMTPPSTYQLSCLGINPPTLVWTLFGCWCFGIYGTHTQFDDLPPTHYVS